MDAYYAMITGGSDGVPFGREVYALPPVLEMYRTRINAFIEESRPWMDDVVANEDPRGPNTTFCLSIFHRPGRDLWLEVMQSTGVASFIKLDGRKGL